MKISFLRLNVPVFACFTPKEKLEEEDAVPELWPQEPRLRLPVSRVNRCRGSEISQILKMNSIGAFPKY